MADRRRGPQRFHVDLETRTAPGADPIDDLHRTIGVVADHLGQTLLQIRRERRVPGRESGTDGTAQRIERGRKIELEQTFPADGRGQLFGR